MRKDQQIRHYSPLWGCFNSNFVINCNEITDLKESIIQYVGGLEERKGKGIYKKCKIYLISFDKGSLYCYKIEANFIFITIFRKFLGCTRYIKCVPKEGRKYH